LAGSQLDAGSLGSNQSLEVKDIEQGALKYLGLDDRSRHSNDGLLRKDNRTIRHGIYIALEPHVTQVFQKCLFKDRPPVGSLQTAEVAQIAVIETEIANIVNNMPQSAGQSKAPLERALAEKQRENGVLLSAAGLPVPICHGQLVLVGK